jgi:serine/threonine-protein kinase RsbW
MSDRYSLHTIAEVKNLASIRDFVESAATALGFDAALIPNTQLAVDEAATNIMLHGYQGRGGSLELEVERRGSDLVVCLRDEAAPFDPTTIPTPDLTLPLAQRSPGGLGVHLMRQTMDELLHRVTATGGNELIMIKRNESVS